MTYPSCGSGFGAGKVCGIVGIARCLCTSPLGIGTQGRVMTAFLSASNFVAITCLPGNTLFYPIDQGIKDSIFRSVGGGDAQLPECGRTGSTRTMFHAGHHVELHKCSSPCRPSLSVRFGSRRWCSRVRSQDHSNRDTESACCRGRRNLLRSGLSNPDQLRFSCSLAATIDPHRRSGYSTLDRPSPCSGSSFVHIECRSPTRDRYPRPSRSSLSSSPMT